jgi:hypothetical protein
VKKISAAAVLLFSQLRNNTNMASRVEKSRMASYEQFKKDFEAKQPDATGASRERLARMESKRQQRLDARAKQIKRRVGYAWISFDDDTEPLADAETVETDTKDFVTIMSLCRSLPGNLEQQKTRGKKMMLSGKSIGSGIVSRHGAIPDSRSLTRDLSFRSRDNVVMPCNEGWNKIEDDDDDVHKIDGMDRLLPPSKTKRGGCFGYCQEDAGKDGAVLQQEGETMQINIVAGCMYVCIMIWYINVYTDMDLGSLFASA